MNEIIISGIVTVTASAISSIITWTLAKKKYNAEVDNNLITNMKESLDFYKQLSDDNRARLDEVLKRNDELEKRDERLELEVIELRRQVMNMMSSLCFDLSCKLRQKGELFNESKTTKKSK